MKILFLAHRFPYPPTFGSKVRAFHMIRHLAQRHEVTVLSLAHSAQEHAAAGGIAPFCHAHRAFRVHRAVQAARMLATLPTPVSASEAHFHCTAMRREVDARLAAGAVDLVVAHCSAVGPYVEQASGVPKIMDFCDVDSLKWRDYAPHKPWPLSLGYRWEAHRVANAERRMARRFDCVTVATRGEAEALAAMGVREGVDWFPNGVDTDFFSPGDDAHDPDLVTFVGRMDYFPNAQCMVEFCATAWPRLRRARPGLRLQIVGAAPPPAVQALARLDGVTVTGAVDDVRPYVRRSAATLAPLAIARGTQNKILESMAMGVPVVASAIAAAGVDAVPGEHLLRHDDVDGLVEAVLRLTRDPAERGRLARAGRARVLSHHAWGPALQRLDAIIARHAGAGHRLDAAPVAA